MTGGFLIVEDEPTLARALWREFRRHRPTEVVHSIADAGAALRGRDDWVGVVLDLILPDGHGLDLLQAIRGPYPALPVLVLTGELRPELINQVQVLRAEYVCKPANAENLRSFVRTALTQETLDDDSVSRRVESASLKWGLTVREAEVLALAMEGLTRRELARNLGVMENTVKAQIRSVLRKTGARSLSSLAQEIIRGASS
jgi:DNA-binding NarL/FixJ family response regulator